MSLVYGPVPSRRLGYSLGISPVPPKTCNYSCIYCQLGPTTNYTNTPKEFYPLDLILSHLKNAIYHSTLPIDHITFVGDGEPTLYSRISGIIKWIRLTFGYKYKIAVLTNGSLLYRRDVQKSLAMVDVVLPSLDAVDHEMFVRINRPYRGIVFERVVRGLRNFRNRFRGEMWLEIMLLKGINDDDDCIERFAEIVEYIGPERVYLNVPIRPPAYPNIEIPNKKRIKKALAVIPNAIALDYIEVGDFDITQYSRFEDAILDITGRHPLRMEQIEAIARNFSLKEWRSKLDEMTQKGKIRIIMHEGVEYTIRCMQHNL